MSKIVFRNRIQEYMDAHRKSDVEILSELDISRDTLYRLKRGSFTRLDAKTAKAFMDFFGLPFDRLFYIDEVEDESEQPAA